MVSFNPVFTGGASIQYTRQATSDKKYSVEISIKQEARAFLSGTRGMTGSNMEPQSALTRFNQLPASLKDTLVYNGRPISALSPEDASALISEDGHFGVKKTSQRISDFVITGAGDNLETLRAGREGVLRGFREVENAWGGKLPDISYETLEKTLAAIDDRIRELDGSVVDLTA